MVVVARPAPGDVGLVAAIGRTEHIDGQYRAEGGRLVEVVVVVARISSRPDPPSPTSRRAGATSVGWSAGRGTADGRTSVSDANETGDGPASDDHCYLTTTGRRTGRPHRIEIWYALDGDTLYLLAGGGRSSDWVRNLEAEPAVTVELEGRVHQARARVAGGGADAVRARSLIFAKYAPREDDDLTGWRDSALPVAVDLERA